MTKDEYESMYREHLRENKIPHIKFIKLTFEESNKKKFIIKQKKLSSECESVESKEQYQNIRFIVEEIEQFVKKKRSSLKWNR